VSRGAEPGPDGGLRCPWALSAPEYLAYHDDEWGAPLRGDDALFERMTLEAFQSGLSWLIILRKRPGFRTAFCDFSIPEVAGFDERDVDRLLADTGIVRNRLKIEAAIANARVAATLDGGLSDLLWSFAPSRPGRAPRTLDEVPSTTPQSTAMAKELKRRGMTFVGPTTAHALMQATGMVDDHLATCLARRLPV
jgi:DNA-3-methyladenine glycosylase I